MSIHKMIAAHPQVAELDDALATAARHAMFCALICTSCADACSAEEMDMRGCVRTCMDCADVCAATARIATRQTADNEAVRRLMLETGAKVCEACAEECEKHDHDHCRRCAGMCRECARDCRAALN